MKDKVIFIGIFGLAFLVVTGIMIYLNSKYNNIFAFDFTPIASEQAEIIPQRITPPPGSNLNADSLHSVILTSIMDSIKNNLKQTQDTVRITVVDTTLIDTINTLKLKLKELAVKKDTKKIAKQDTVKLKIEPVVAAPQVPDSTYRTWVRKTVSLCEAMDPRKAAKIIITYSDNVAKDILYSMKKKKAADIIAQLNPETVNRITKIK